MMSQQHTALAKLRIYQAGRQLEDHVYTLVKDLPPTTYYPLGDSLRRTSAAICHYIYEGHRRYSYALKLEALHQARQEAERLQRLLAEVSSRGYSDTKALQESCTTIIKQAWGLIKYLKKRQNERQETIRINAADALVSARS
jgi:four helix bundle protein